MSGDASVTRRDSPRVRILFDILCLTLLLLAVSCSDRGSSQAPDPTGAGGAGGSGVGATTTLSSATTGSGGTGIGGTGIGGTGVGGTGVGGTGVGGTGVDGTGVGGTGSAAGGTGSAGTSGAGGTGGGVGGTGTSGACTFQCVDECAAWGGSEQPGACQGEQRCCEGASQPIDPLAHLVDSAREVGLLLANRFGQQALVFDSVASLPPDGYKTACEWYGSLGVSSLTNNQDLTGALVTKFDPLQPGFVAAMTSGEAHVDRYIFGIVPLEIYLRTGDDSYLSMGLEVADIQQETNQTRGAIDDMFMMTSLQLQAYRASGEDKYIDFMASTMVDYLDAQQDNGLFFHNETQARVQWGRGNGWFAAGLAEMMRDLPSDHTHYPTIEAGYQKMMNGLLAYQSSNGLWYQVLDLPEDDNNWEESSGSAMFAYAMVAGVRRGILDAATYVPAIEAAWSGLRGKISPQGNVTDICEGTWYHDTPQQYMALNRLTGDGHGQAPVLWVAAELLR